MIIFITETYSRNMDMFDRIIFVSFERGGGGHRVARTLAAMPEHYWYSHPDNGIHPWNIHFTHTEIRQRHLSNAHFDRIVPLGKLPPTWDYVSDFFPDPAAYYDIFYKKFIEVAPVTDQKFIYCTHSTPGELRKFFPNNKIINIVSDVKTVTDRHMHTTALFTGWVRLEGLVDENNEHLKFLSELKQLNDNFTIRDIWAMRTHNVFYNEDMKSEYYNYVYAGMQSRLFERMHYVDANTCRAIDNPDWRDVKFLLVS
jgi:hypothetical protein